MLVLRRAAGQTINLPGNIQITIKQLEGNRVRLAVQPPSDSVNGTEECERELTLGVHEEHEFGAVSVTILACQASKVRLGIAAPKDLRSVRQEAAAPARADRMAMSADAVNSTPRQIGCVQEIFVSSVSVGGNDNHALDGDQPTRTEYQAADDLASQLRLAIVAHVSKPGGSLSELGNSSGLDRGQLSRFLWGERELSLAAAEKLCKALGLELRSRNDC